MVMGALILFSIPIPWTIHAAERKVFHLSIADTLYIPTSGKLPFFLWPLTKPDDALQKWLTNHLVCVRRQEHKLFLEDQLKRYPRRSLEVPEYAGKYPLAYFSTVGVPGWVFPNVAIIDGYGLNDYIIAHHEPYPREERKMAHDRYPPEQYVQSFVPNMRVVAPGMVKFYKRPPQLELTPERIREIEDYWEKKIVEGIDVPDSALPSTLRPANR